MIFLIGGRGLVGSAIARALTAQGREFAVIQRENYRDYAGQSCDLLINANGSSSKRLAEADPLADFRANVESVRATLADFRFERYLLVSSCDVYPDCSSPAATREDQPLDAAAESGYGFHKRLAELCVEHAARDWIVARMGGFVGPGLKKNPIYDILFGERLFLDPESELQFLHTDDAARILLALGERGPGREIVNVCGRGLVRLAEVMERARRTVTVAPASPRVRYDVNIEKLSRWTLVPETRETVLRFVDDATGAH